MGIDDVDTLEIFKENPPTGLSIVITEVGEEKHTLTFVNGILITAVPEE